MVSLFVVVGVVWLGCVDDEVAWLLLVRVTSEVLVITLAGGGLGEGLEGERISCKPLPVGW